MKVLISIIAGVYIMRKHGILEMLLTAVVIYLVLGWIMYVLVTNRR